jgi:Tol biopolymer transport system component
MHHATTSSAWLGIFSTRRAFVKRSIMMGVAIPVMSSLLAACGGDDDADDTPAADTNDEPTATTTTGPTTETPASESSPIPTESPAGEPTSARMDATAPAGTATIAASPTSLATETQPAMGAVSGQLAFSGMPEGGSASAISLVGSDGSGLETLWTWDDDWSHAVYLVWSPDGRQLAFYGLDAGTKSLGLYVLDASGGSPTHLLEVGTMWYPPVWSPDGSQLYVSASAAPGGSGIWVVPADGSGTPTDVIAEQGGMETPLRISPDGQQMAVTVLTSSGPQLAVLRVDDPQRRVLVDDLMINSGLVWSPDSRQVAFIGQAADGIGQLYVVNADGTGRSQLSDHQPPDAVASGFVAAEPVCSPDGQQIAYTVVTTQQEVYLASVDGSGTRNLSNDPQHADTGPSWSPDGRALAFISQGDIRVIMADGTHPQTVVTGFQFGSYAVPLRELISLPAWRPPAP